MPTDPTRAQAVFIAAAEITDPAARAAFLAEACGGDVHLKARIEALLRAHDQPDSLLDAPLISPPDADHASTRVFAPNPDVTRTDVGGTAASDDEPLTFLSPSVRPDSLGRIGHYEVLQFLGKGGFGIVFRAFDDVLQRVVAVKVMAPQLAATSPARKRFLREAQNSAKVRHENVVQVYEVAEQPLPYLAMEFIPGETLQQKLDRNGPLEVSEVLRIGRQVAEGLAAAHATELIHRDIKPANVLIESGPQQKVKITDFGLARAADDASISQSGIIAGTPMFMAPEQAKGEKLDQRADLFSLGSVLYQIASGRSPFRANSTVAVLKRVAEDTPRDIREIIPETPQWLCNIIAKLHAKDPDDRYQSAREVADVLADCEAQLKANSKLKDFSRIPGGRSQPSVRRKRVAAAAILLLPAMALAVTEFAGLTHLFRTQQAATDLSQHADDPYSVASQEPPLAIAPFDGAQAKHHQEAWAKYLGVPVEFTNSIGMKMRLIPPGKFMMGSSPEEADRVLASPAVQEWMKDPIRSETPTRSVTIRAPYLIGIHEVTVGQFREFVKATSYKTRAELYGGGGDWNDAFKGFKQEPECVWNNPRYATSEVNPVGFIAAADAIAFCAWLTKEEGRRYQVPTEEQWEFACRAGTTTRFFFGDDETPMKEFGWILPNSGHSLHAVGRLGANPFGLFDVYGNANELAIDSTGRPVERGGDTWQIWERVRSAARFDAPQMWPRSGFRVVVVDNLKSTNGPPPSAPVTNRAPLPPFTDADVQRIATLPAANQIEEVRKELMRRNSGFDGKVKHKIENGVVTELRINTDNVTDISPIRVFNSLSMLECTGSHSEDWQRGTGQLADLTPLRDMKLDQLTVLELSYTNVGDSDMVHFKNCKELSFIGLASTRVTDIGLENFKNCKNLGGLYLNHVQVTDAGLQYFRDRRGLWGIQLAGAQVTDEGLAVFRGCTKIKNLDLGGTRVSNSGLTIFKDCKNVSMLWIQGTRITDLSPLKGLPLTFIICDFMADRDAAILRSIKTLETINNKPAVEFWKEVDRK